MALLTSSLGPEGNKKEKNIKAALEVATKTICAL
jgi:hypothetical protein